MDERARQILTEDVELLGLMHSSLISLEPLSASEHQRVSQAIERIRALLAGGSRCSCGHGPRAHFDHGAGHCGEFDCYCRRFVAAKEASHAE